MAVLAALQSGWTQREERHTVSFPARMRDGAGWIDAHVHNVSRHGMMIACDKPPAHGSVVDVRHNTLIFIGRVRWSKGRFFGIQTQDPVPVEAVRALTGAERGIRRRPRAVADASVQERRVQADARVARRIERSQQFARLFQFTVLLLGLAAACIFTALTVHDVLRTPIDTISAAIGGN